MIQFEIIKNLMGLGVGKNNFFDYFKQYSYEWGFGFGVGVGDMHSGPIGRGIGPVTTLPHHPPIPNESRRSRDEYERRRRRRESI